MKSGRSFSRGALNAYRSATRVRDKLFSLAVSGAFARFGSETVIQLPVRLSGERRMSIGSGVFVGAGSWLQTLGSSDAVALEIGDGTSIAGNCVVSAAASVRIGERVLIARGAYISDHAHAYERTDVPIADQGIANIRPVVVGDGAWIGENTVITPGAVIGAGAVVAANSVVSSEIPPYSVAIGSPARVVRRYGKDGAAEAPSDRVAVPAPAAASVEESS